MDRETLKKLITSAVAAAKFGASLSSTEVDDKVVTQLESLISQPWFFDLVEFVMNQFEHGKEAKLEDVIGAVKQFGLLSGAKYN